MGLNAYHPGDSVTLDITGIQTSSGTIVDPTPLYCTYWPHGVSSGTELTTASDITKVTTGSYYCRVVPTSSQVGQWHYRWNSTGNYRFVEWGSFRVLEPPRST